ncbi:MAG TPA: UvrD-helicase domain-containing protein [Clostridiales bacterium]|nr:UvrD-helicase domain-containing protein [Clostridiales bacterium]
MAEQADLKKQTASAEDLHPDTAPEHGTKPKIRWTEKQEEAISARKGTILVSAAAGSGKTAVLVERVIQRLTDEADPCNANELLIVTFTKAATAEMLPLIRRHFRRTGEGPGEYPLTAATAVDPLRANLHH